MAFYDDYFTGGVQGAVDSRAKSLLENGTPEQLIEALALSIANVAYGGADSGSSGTHQLQEELQKMYESGGTQALESYVQGLAANNPLWKRHPDFAEKWMPGITKILNALPAARQRSGNSQAGNKDTLQDASGSTENPIQKFYEAMMRPLDANDPYVQNLTRQAQVAGQTDARMRGIQGGLAVGNTQNRVVHALNDAQMQRQQLGLQAYSALQGDRRFAQDVYDRQYENQLAQQQAQYQSNLNAQRALMGYAGGLVNGAIAGVTSNWSPSAMQTGFTSGSQTWAGLGGAAYQPPPSTSYNPPSQPRGFYTGS